MSPYLILIIFIFIIGAFLFLISKNLLKKRLAQALNLKLLLIRLPQKQQKDSSTEGRQISDWKNEINLSAQLFSVLSGLKSPFGFETAVHHIGEEIHFYAAVPKESIEFVSRQIEGLWKDASVEPINDYNIFNSAGASTGIYLKQKISYSLPIRTYAEAEVDTFAPILSGLSKISEVGEGAAIQVLIRPAPKSAKKSILQIIENLKKGKKMEEALGAMTIKFKDISSALSPSGKEKEKEEKREQKIIDEEAIKALESKINKPLLSVNLRILVSAPSNYQEDIILEKILGGFFFFFFSPPKKKKNKKKHKPITITISYLFFVFSFSLPLGLKALEISLNLIVIAPNASSIFLPFLRFSMI